MTTLSTQVLLNYIDQEARAQGVDPVVARAIFSSENGSLKDGKLIVNPSADTMTTSPKGAMGLMQVMPATFQGLVSQGFLPPDTDYSTPQGQIRAGIASLRERMNAGINDPMELAISYNGGPKVLERFKKTGELNPETTTYLQKFQQALGGKPVAATSTSVRTSTSGKIIPEEEQKMLDDALANYKSVSTDVLQQLQDLTGNMLGGINAAKTAGNSVGQAGAEAAWAKGQNTADVINNQHKVLGAFGIDLDGDPVVNQGIQRSLATIKQVQEAKAPLGASISQLQATNPLDDPLGWLVNNFKAMGQTQTYNALVRKENAAVEDLRTLQALATNQAALQPGNIADNIKIQAEAEGRLKLAEAQEKSALLDIQGSQILARNLNEQLNVAKATVDQRLATARLYAERYGLSQVDSQRAERKQEENDFIDRYNLTFAPYGVQPINNLATFKLLTPAIQNKIYRFVQTGSGVDMADTVSTLRYAVGDAGLQRYAQQNPQGGRFLEAIISGGKKELQMAKDHAEKTGMMDPDLKAAKTEGDQLEYGMRKWDARKKAELSISDYSKLEKDNPAKIDYGVAATIPALADNPFAKLIRENGPGGTAGKNIIIDDKLLFSSALASIRPDGKNIPATAHYLSELYRTTLAQQSMAASMTSYGWKMPDKYPLQMKVSSVPFSGGAVDAMSPASIESWLVQQHTQGALMNKLMDFSSGAWITNDGDKK